jgi:hypothetical protein
MDVIGTADPYFHAKIDDGQIEFRYVHRFRSDFLLKKCQILVPLVLLIL